MLEGFREQQRQAEQLREASSRGTKDREVGAVIGRQGTDPRASFPACSDTVEAGSPASSLQDSINQLVDLLKRQQSPGEGSWRREAKDPSPSSPSSPSPLSPCFSG